MNNMPIKPVEAALRQMTTSAQPSDQNLPAEKASFGQWLTKSIEAANEIQQEGDNAAMKLVSGESKDIHGTMIAMQKASISLSLMMEVRNKIISAYDEIKRMQF
jgi:flagellar hook-basal body complex protein FliE